MNKRKLIFAGLFGFVFVFTIMMLSGFASADAIYIKSRNRNFDSDQPGSWRVTKSAEWVGKGKARLTLKAESKMIDAGGARDVVYILDTSKSMENTIGALKEVMKTAVDDVLSNSNNTMSLITFNSSASIVQTMTNNKDTIKNAIDGVGVAGDTNYYDAVLKLEDLLANYQERTGRTLVVVFITDGRPGIQTPLEAAEYRAFKSRFPNSVVNGVQYNYDGVLEQLKTVSDYQINLKYSQEIDMRTQFAEAVKTAYNFDTYELTDIIDTNYFTIGEIEASLGNASKSGNTVTWNMNKLYRTGTTEELTIDVTLKDAYLTGSQNEFSPNTKTTIRTHLEDVPDENVENTTSPKLTLRFDVKYEANAPIDCTVSGTLPSTTRQIVFDVVPISQNKLQCPGYNFKRWVIANDGVRRINEDYFLMPNEVVTIKAVWEKIGIDKTTDGEIYGTYSALLGSGPQVGAQIKQLVNGDSSLTYTSPDEKVKAIKYANALPADFTASSANTISSRNSQLPIYIWFDNADGTLYFYSSADTIYSNADMQLMFCNFKALENIEGLSKINTSNTTNMYGLFESSYNFSNLDPIAGWNVSNVRNMAWVFYGDGNAKDKGKITSLQALSGWNTSNATDMSFIFAGQAGLTSLGGIEGWDTSKVEKLNSAFSNNINLTNINAVCGWNTESLTSINGVFSSDSSIASYSCLSGWDTSKVTSFGSAFSGSSITDLSALRNWNVSNGTSFSMMFRQTEVSDLSPLSGWNVGNATTLTWMFNETNVDSLYPLRNWDVSNVKDMWRTFMQTKITSLNGLESWNVSNATSFLETFSHNYYLTDISAVRHWVNGQNVEVRNMFAYDPALTGSSLLPLADWDTSGLTSIEGLFYADIRVDNLNGLRSWNTSNITNMNSAFQGMHGLTSLSALSGWNVSNVTVMGGIFSAWIGTTELRDNIGYTEYYGQHLTSLDGLQSWDVRKVTRLDGAFAARPGLSDISALSNWKTNSVENISGILYYTAIRNVDPLRNWNVSNVTNVGTAFQYCYWITDLSALNNWAIQSSTQMVRTFDGVPTSVTRPTWYHD